MTKTVQFEYHVLELIKSDTALMERFSRELTQEKPDVDNLELIIREASARQDTVARRKVLHAIENQLPAIKEVLREVAVQNTIDAYTDLTTLLTRRGEHVEYPLKINVDFTEKGKDRYDIAIRDHAIGMNLHDVLCRLLAVGDTTKTEKTSQVGGHGRGFKPSAAHASPVIIESFGRKTRVVGDKTGTEHKYFIQIGEESDIWDGTRITLENVSFQGSPLPAVQQYAVKLTDEFEFRVNGIRVNKGIDPPKIGRLPYVETHTLSGANVPLEDTVVACAKDVEATEVRQGAMSMLTNPAGERYTRRILKVPTGYLFSRSRNALPQSIEEIVTGDKRTFFKNFATFVRNQFDQIGSHEFQFLDTFYQRADAWKEKVKSLAVVSKRTALYFTAGVGFMALANFAIIPGLQWAKEYAAYRSAPATYSSSNWVVPITHLPQVDEQEFVLVNSYELVRESFKRTPFFNKVQQERLLGTYSPARKLFFRIMGYEILNADGSWTNRDLGSTLRIGDPLYVGSEIAVTLNLDVRNKTILPLPIGYTVNSNKVLRPKEALLRGNTLYTETGPHDLVTIESISEDSSEGVHFLATRQDTIYSEVEALYTGKKQRPFPPLGELIEVPFRMEYPPDLEKMLAAVVNNRSVNIAEAELKDLKEELKSLDALRIDYNQEWERLRQGIKRAEAVRYESIADEVRAIFSSYFVYNTSRENVRRFKRAENFVNHVFRLKQVDCDVANGAYCATLRDKFKMATRLAIGIQGIDGILDIENAHGICEVYIPGEGWRAYDATPHELSSEMFKVRPLGEAARRVSVEGRSKNYTITWGKVMPSWLRKLMERGKGKDNNSTDSIADTELPAWMQEWAHRINDSGSGEVLGRIPPEIILGLGFLPLTLVAYALIKQADLWNVPLVDTYHKRENDISPERITLNEGIEYLIQKSLWYDKRVVEEGMPRLRQEDLSKGRYVLDHGYYSLMVERAGIQNRTVALLADTTSQREGNNGNPLQYVGLDSSVKGKIPSKTAQANKDTISAMQQLFSTAAYANGYKAPKIVAGEFKEGDKFFGVTWRKIYVNVEHERMRQDHTRFDSDPAIVDSVVYSLLLFKNTPLNRFRATKERFLNARYIPKT